MYEVIDKAPGLVELVSGGKLKALRLLKDERGHHLAICTDVDVVVLVRERGAGDGVFHACPGWPPGAIRALKAIPAAELE